MVIRNWQILSAKVRGAMHIRKDLPCQDAICFHTFMPGGFVCAIADGHGSMQCPYSEDGAYIAARTAVRLVEEMAFYNDEKQLKALLMQVGEVTLPKQIERQWKENIKQFHSDMGRTPQVKKKVNSSKTQQEATLYKLYGTTLMLLVIIPGYLYAAQIGDGDMLWVDDKGSVQPIIEADKTYGVETRSLCEKKAWQAFKIASCCLTEDFKGRLFLMSTDGYANSFVSSEDFLQIGSDYLNLLRQGDWHEVEKMLPIWLEQASIEGSGDDITLALIMSKEG